MASNPMQKKARMYLLLGVFVTLIITGVIIAFLFMQILNMKKEQNSYRSVYVLSQDVKSGEELIGKLIPTVVPTDAYPSDAFHGEEIINGQTIPANAISSTAVSKNALKKGTIITEGMVAESEETTTDDLRMQEYNMIILPTMMTVGDYIDIRLQLPNGQDFIVISKKKVEDANADTVWMKLTEDETLTMSSAIVEAYIMTGSKLYAVTYVEAGSQAEAIATYVPCNDVISLINSDSNISSTAQTKLSELYSKKKSADSPSPRDIRNGAFNNEVNKYSETAQENIQAGMAEQITKAKELRQQYVDGL